MLRARPELVNMGVGGGRASRDPLRGFRSFPRDDTAADAAWRRRTAGIYPHREATTALTLATERGYDDIVAIIREEEQRRRETHAGTSAVPLPPDDFPGRRIGRAAARLEMLKADPALARSSRARRRTPLHAAACELDEEASPGCSIMARIRICACKGTWTPHRPGCFRRRSWDEKRSSREVRRSRETSAEPRRELGPFRPSRWERRSGSGPACGRCAGKSQRHIDSTCRVNMGGYFRLRSWHDRPEMLALLLDLGLDPDERMRVGGMDEILYSAGGSACSAAS